MEIFKTAHDFHIATLNDLRFAKTLLKAETAEIFFQRGFWWNSSHLSLEKGV